MTLVVSDFVWVSKLDRKYKEIVFDPAAFEDNMRHSILLKRAVLEPSDDSLKYESNIVEIETIGYTRQKIKEMLLFLRRTEEKPYATDNIDLAICHPVVLRLIRGSGPISIFGQHLILRNNSDNKDEEEDTESSISDESEVDDFNKSKDFDKVKYNIKKTKRMNNLEDSHKKRKHSKSFSALPGKIPRLKIEEEEDADCSGKSEEDNLMMTIPTKEEAEKDKTDSHHNLTITRKSLKKHKKERKKKSSHTLP